MGAIGMIQFPHRQVTISRIVAAGQTQKAGIVYSLSHHRYLNIFWSETTIHNSGSLKNFDTSHSSENQAGSPEIVWLD
jgi:hypothetical protein